MTEGSIERLLIHLRALRAHAAAADPAAGASLRAVQSPSHVNHALSR
jgi:hypothetical protein